MCSGLPALGNSASSLWDAAGVRVVGEAGDGTTALTQVAAQDPDVVLMSACPG